MTAWLLPVVGIIQPRPRPAAPATTAFAAFFVFCCGAQPSKKQTSGYMESAHLSMANY